MQPPNADSTGGQSGSLMLTKVQQFARYFENSVLSRRIFLEKELVLRTIAGCDSIGSRPRRDWGNDFTTPVEVSSLDFGVSARTRSRRLPAGRLLVWDDRFNRDHPRGMTRGSACGIFFFSLALGEATTDLSESASSTQSEM